MATRLFDLLAADLPHGFARALIDRMQHIYAEAHESVTHDTRFGEDEARYMFGHTRWALTQFALRELATTHGLRVKMRRAMGVVGGFEHVMLETGRFCFTHCHLQSLNGFPKESRHREQYAHINEHAAQGQLFALPSAPSEADLYGIICHCESVGNRGNLGTLMIGFPNEQCDDWIEEPISIVDLADVQDRQEQQGGASDAVAPKWKKHKKQGGDES